VEHHVQAAQNIQQVVDCIHMEPAHLLVDTLELVLDSVMALDIVEVQKMGMVSALEQALQMDM